MRGTAEGTNAGGTEVPAHGPDTASITSGAHLIKVVQELLDPLECLLFLPLAIPHQILQPARHAQHRVAPPLLRPLHRLRESRQLNERAPSDEVRACDRPGGSQGLETTTKHEDGFKSCLLFRPTIFRFSLSRQAMQSRVIAGIVPPHRLVSYQRPPRLLSAKNAASVTATSTELQLPPHTTPPCIPDPARAVSATLEALGSSRGSPRGRAPPVEWRSAPYPSSAGTKEETEREMSR